MQGERKLGLKVGQHWGQVSWPAVGHPWLPGLGGPPSQETWLAKRGLEGISSSAVACHFYHSSKDAAVSPSTSSALVVPFLLDPSLPLLVDQLPVLTPGQT